MTKKLLFTILLLASSLHATHEQSLSKGTEEKTSIEISLKTPKCTDKSHTLAKGDNLSPNSYDTVIINKTPSSKPKEIELQPFSSSNLLRPNEGITPIVDDFRKRKESLSFSERKEQSITLIDWPTSKAQGTQTPKDSRSVFLSFIGDSSHQKKQHNSKDYTLSNQDSIHHLLSLQEKQQRNLHREAIASKVMCCMISCCSLSIIVAAIVFYTMVLSDM